MNGRIFDPVLGRMLSPDNFVQSPNFTQSYNRYSYCSNNPLKYIDPSGWQQDEIYTPPGSNWWTSYADLIAGGGNSAGLGTLAPISNFNNAFMNNIFHGGSSYGAMMSASHGHYATINYEYAKDWYQKVSYGDLETTWTYTNTTYSYSTEMVYVYGQIYDGFFGSTTTNTTGYEKDIFNNEFGRLSVRSYIGKKTGNEGVLNSNSSTFNKHFQGGDVNISLFNGGIGGSLGYTSDIGLSAGITLFNLSGLLSISLSGISVDGNYTNNQGAITGYGFTYMPGYAFAFAVALQYMFSLQPR